MTSVTNLIEPDAKSLIDCSLNTRWIFAAISEMNKRDSSDEAKVALRRLRQQSVVVALVMLAALLLTSFDLPLTWDEGNGVIRSYPLVTWFEKQR